MSKLELLVRKIETIMRVNPDIIWNYLLEDDLLITKSGTNLFIVCVDSYDARTNAVRIKFVFALGAGTFYVDNGLEPVSSIIRYPTNKETQLLFGNVNYKIYRDNG